MISSLCPILTSKIIHSSISSSHPRTCQNTRIPNAVFALSIKSRELHIATWKDALVPNIELKEKLIQSSGEFVTHTAGEVHSDFSCSV